jgi:hypothetical protein
MAPGFPACRQFFRVSEGSFIYMPRVLGLPPAQVEATFFHDRARYVVRYPLGGGWLGWLRRALMWPFTVRVAARELKDAHVVLQQRYGELQDARRLRCRRHS